MPKRPFLAFLALVLALPFLGVPTCRRSAPVGWPWGPKVETAPEVEHVSPQPVHLPIPTPEPPPVPGSRPDLNRIEYTWRWLATLPPYPPGSQDNGIIGKRHQNKIMGEWSAVYGKQVRWIVVIKNVDQFHDDHATAGILPAPASLPILKRFAKAFPAEMEKAFLDNDAPGSRSFDLPPHASVPLDGADKLRSGDIMILEAKVFPVRPGQFNLGFQDPKLTFRASAASIP